MALTFIPNALTIARCGLAFVSAFAVLAGEQLSRRLDGAVAAWQAAGGPPPGSPGYPDLLSSLTPGDLLLWPAIAFATFLVAALTDLLDGVFARALDAHSDFGAWLDPIADKLLIGLGFSALAMTTRSLWLIIPAAVIITRDAYITWLRARQSNGLGLPVAKAAKWKTGVEMLALGLLLGLPILAAISHDVMVSGAISPSQMSLIAIIAERAGLALTWIAAVLSAWTGFGYWRTAQRGPSALTETFE
ncbi:MAG: CDP-alcohol phosphatidyltransferase family protein [Pseudomonadota bacterium]